MISRFQVMPLALFVAVAAVCGADDSGSASDKGSDVTWSKDIAPLFEARCMDCHRAGRIGPMSLLTHEEVRPWAKSIKAEVAARRMPPWHADPVAGPYEGDSSLTEDEIAMVSRWIDAGAPAGDPADLPPPPQFSDDWVFGEPDLVLGMAEPYNVPALEEGGDNLYRCFVLPEAEEDYWVRGHQVRAGNYAVNHHVALFLDKTGKQALRNDARTPEPGYPCFGSANFQPMDILGIWAPGMAPEMLPEGVARPVPKGSRLVMQLHYSPGDEATTDQSSIGLYFHKGPVRQKLNVGIALDFALNIPAGETEYESVAAWGFPANADIIAVFPHMHLLGKSINVDVGTEEGPIPLVHVSRYDFNWQRNYFFRDPVRVSKGDRLTTTAKYDNSADNPYNPSSPPADVRFGMNTQDEMNVTFFYYVNTDEDRVASGAGFPTEDTIVMSF